MRVTVHKERCCGSGQCALIAPSVFDQSDEDGTVVLLDGDPPPELLPAVRAAVNRCPANAITADES